MRQQKSAIGNVQDFEREFNRRLREYGCEPGRISVEKRMQTLAGLCHERNVALTVLTDRIAFVHKDSAELCLHVEYDPVGTDVGTVEFEPFVLDEALHEALSQVKETVSQEKQ